MDNALFWNIFEPSISLVENILLISFLHTFLPRKRRGLVGWCGFCGVVGVGFAFSFIENMEPIVSWEVFITIALLLGYALLFLQGSIVKKIVVSIAARQLTTISNSFVIFLCVMLLNIDADTFLVERTAARIIVIILTKIVYFFLSQIISGLFARHGILFTWQWFVAGMGFLMSTIAGSVAISLLHSGVVHTATATLQVFIIVSCIWGLSALFYFITAWMMRDNDKKLKQKLTDQEQQAQIERYIQTQKSNDEIASIQHDMLNYISSLQHLVEQGDYDHAIMFCRELTQKVEKVQVYLHTDVSFIDAVLNEKISASKRKEIDTKCSIFSKLDKIDALAFCSVFGNLMDNAMEAEEKFPVENRYIAVEIYDQYGYVWLKVSNYTDGSVLSSNPHFQTTKRTEEGHGIGHLSVKRTMEEIDGAIRYNELEHLFIAKAAFPPKE